MATLGELFVNITANTDKFDKSINESKKQTDNFSTGVSSMTKNITSLVAGVSVLALVSKLKDVAIASINAASAAQETQAKFNTAFKGIEDDAAAVAEKLATNYGLARQESEQLLAGTADLVKGFGANATQALATSEEIQKLSVDLASYNNLQGGATQASEILTKAYLGERDSLVSLGIKVSEADVKQELLRKGQDKLTGSALMLAKGQATLELATKQSGDAIGDFARTSDSYANVTRRAEAATNDLKVELGRSLLPTATTVKNIYGELVGKLGDYLQKQNDIAVAERAREAGIATRQQELLLVDEQIASNEEYLEVYKRQAYAEELAHGETLQATTDIIEALGTKLYRLNKEKDAIEEVIHARSEQEQKEAEAAALAVKQAEEAEARALAERNDYNAKLKLIDEVIDADKSEIEVIDEQIEALNNLVIADQEGKDKRLEAVRILEETKTEIEETAAQEKKDREDKEEKDRLAREAKILEDHIKLQKQKEDAVANSVAAIADIYSTFTEIQLNNIESEYQAKIEALDATLLGEEEYNSQVEALEQKQAQEEYDLKLKAFKTQKALDTTDTIISGALAAQRAYSSLAGIPVVGPALGVAAAAASAGFTIAQVGLINSQPPPAKPAFATGGVVMGQTDIIAGEDRGEVLIGMGAKGAPLLNELAERIGEQINGSGGTVVNNYYQSLFNTADPSDLRKFNRVNRPYLVAEEQRIGARS